MKYAPKLLPTLLLFLWGSLGRAQTIDYCVRNVTIIQPERSKAETPHQDVFVRSGMIVRIAPTTAKEPKHCTHIIDASGKFLMAGLADMHVHLHRRSASNSSG
jgi:dihydroorotase-like cyclic amidohydrolase